jgi:hypothetical protein
MNSGVVLLGNGDGILQGAPILAPSAEDISLLTVFASGDLDGDGIPDFVAFDYSDVSASDNPNQLPTIVSLISDGKGGLKRKATAIPESYFIQKGSSFIVVEPMAVDLTGDGKADLLLSTGNDVEVAYGNGDGTFQTPIVLNLGGGFATLDCIPGLASAGRGSDGVLEFVVAYGGDNSCRGTGGQASGVFAFTNGGAAVAFTPLGTSLVDAKLTDLNSDGVLDLVTNDSHEESGTFAVYATKGTGDATFDPAETNTIESGYLISDILTGDYNQDGVADLVLASMGVIASGNLVDNTGGVLLLPGNNDGSFGPTTLADGGLPVQAAAWGDFNGDGLPDLAVSQFLGKPYNPYLQYWLEAFSFAVLPNAGDGTFPVSQPFESLSMAPIFVGDYTSNGNADVAVPEFAGSVSLFINTLPSPRLTLSATPSSLALTQGATGVLTIAVAANDAFNGTVNFSCSGAPSESTCTVNPTTFALARGQSASITVVVATTAPNNFYSAHNGNPPGGIGWKDLAGGTQLAVCILCMIPKRTRRKISVLPTLLLVGFLGGCFLCGCGAGGTRQPMYGGTPTGSTTLTITATSGSLMQSITLPLTVMSNSPGQSMMTTK